MASLSRVLAVVASSLLSAASALAAPPPPASGGGERGALEAQAPPVLDLAPALDGGDRGPDRRALEPHDFRLGRAVVVPAAGADGAAAGSDSASGSFAPIALPFSSWAEVWKDRGEPEEGLLFDGCLEQAVDWFAVEGLTLSTYGAIRWSESERQDVIWGNRTGLWLGVEAKRSFGFGDAIRGSAAVGFRREQVEYTIDEPDQSRFLYYVEWAMGGDLRDALGLGGPDPLRLPLSSWGFLSYAEGDLEEGVLLDTYAEQAVGWRFRPDLAIDAFGGVRCFESDRDVEPWNNRVGAIFGLRAEVRLPFFPNPTLLAGVRGERYWYTSTDDDELFRVSFFVGWGFGGDWKALPPG